MHIQHVIYIAPPDVVTPNQLKQLNLKQHVQMEYNAIIINKWNKAQPHSTMSHNTQKQLNYSATQYN